VLSALKGALPVLIAVGFVLWVLVRRRRVRDGLGAEAVQSTGRSDSTGQLDSTNHSDSIDQPDSPVVDQPHSPTAPPRATPTPVRWEPPVRSGPPLPRPSRVPDPSDEAAARSRRRIEDLLERAKNEDEGAA
jgi:hypothetical protein